MINSRAGDVICDRFAVGVSVLLPGWPFLLFNI